MEHELKMSFTRFVTLLASLTLGGLILLHGFQADSTFVYYNVPGLLLALSIFVLTFIASNKIWIPYLVPLSMFVLYVVTGEIAMENGNRLPTGGLILFPVYTFFFMGIKMGTVVVAAMGLWAMVSPVALHGLTPAVYGMNINSEFPFIYSLSVILCYALEVIRNKLTANLRFLSSHDELTGLINRSGFLKILNDLTIEEKHFKLALLDLDYFTKINSSLGTDLCDELLKQCADILKESKVLYASRWYGDQFVFVYMDSIEELNELLGIIQKKVQAIPRHMDFDFPLSFSTGTIEFNADFTVEEIMANVNIALLEAKTGANGEIHLFNDDDNVKHKRALAIQHDILGAIINEELQVHFQPKVSTHTGEVVGMEALSRWIHPEFGYIIPPEFIAAAEKGNLICELGEYVLIQSLHHLKKCFELGYTDMRVSVNISPLHLLHNDFLKRMVALCSKYDVSPSSVCLEITENILVRDEIKELMSSLQSVGFTLSLDDFGTGYSSLSYLSSFRFDELKIDKSFTDKILESERDRDLFAMIVELSNRFKMKTVVEGLETEEQKVLVDALGIDEIQGWFYSKALPSDEFLDYLKNFPIPR